jgi:hypothetical protein
MMLNEVLSLWFIENLQIPFKLILSIFLCILISFKALVCQIFTKPMGVGLKWCMTTCYKILKLFLQKKKSIFNFFSDFAHSFSKYSAWNETEWNIDSIFGVSVHVVDIWVFVLHILDDFIELGVYQILK